MRTAAVAVLAAGAALLGGGALVLAQTPAPPKYYPGTISPNPAGAPPVVVAATPTIPVKPAAAAAPKAKLFAPVDSPIRPAGASEPEAPKPLEAIPIPGLPKPMVTAERQPNVPNTPAITPLPPSLKPEPVAPLETPKSPTEAPIPLLAPSASVIPTSSSLNSKQAPSVSVEFEMPESIGVGQPLVYALVVKNTGTCAVSGVRVDQELPAGASYQNSEPAAETATESKLAWSLGTLEAGAEKRIKVTVKPADEGELRGRASVSFNSTVESKVKVTRPRINVAVSAPEVVRVGDKAVFTIKLSNTGSGPANALTLHARLTDGLGHPAGNVIEAPLANLPAGQTKTLTLETTGLKPGPQQCTLTVFADTNAGESAKANVSLVEPQLLAKQTGPTKCFVKGEPVYTIELSNPGTTATDPVTVWTMIPEGFEFVSATEGGTFTATNRAIVWKLAGLTAGSNKSLSAKLRSTAPSDGIVRTLAQSGPGEPAKGKTLEVKCETAVKSEGLAALRFEVVDLDDPVEVGKEAVYEIKLTNQGTGPCTNIVVVAELADGTTAGATTGPTNGRPNGNTIVFDALPQLPVKGEALYKVRVKGAAAGDTRFRVKLTSDQVKAPLSKEENTRFYKE